MPALKEPSSVLFTDYLAPADDDPRYDLDMSALSLVKYPSGQKGRTYPDLEWEPKESFRTVAHFYAEQRGPR
jgi:hypothetical protein